MIADGRARILCVDDEPNVLAGLTRLLHRRYDVETAGGGDAALALLDAASPFAVVVSDLHMPGLGGVELLRRVRQRAPDTVRVLLTGHADLEAAIAAINEGHVFRFLTKPVAPEALVNSLSDAVEQFRLRIAERELLERTLHGSIKTLVDILAQTQPAAFGRATRLKQHVAELAVALGIEDRWHIEVAAMLSQMACVTLPPETANKVYYGMALTPEEQAMVRRLPGVTDGLLANIPRLGPVREILAHQWDDSDDRVPRCGSSQGPIPLGARLLHVALDFDILQTRGLSTAEALAIMEQRNGRYDSRVLETFAELHMTTRDETGVPETSLRLIEPGMVFVEDVRTPSGLLLIARGQEVTVTMAERLRNLSTHLRVGQRVRVRVPKAG